MPTGPLQHRHFTNVNWMKMISLNECVVDEQYGTESKSARGRKVTKIQALRWQLKLGVTRYMPGAGSLGKMHACVF